MSDLWSAANAQLPAANIREIVPSFRRMFPPQSVIRHMSPNYKGGSLLSVFDENRGWIALVATHRSRKFREKAALPKMDHIWLLDDWLYGMKCRFCAESPRALSRLLFMRPVKD